ncbi:MAG: cupredoxin family copper-binding protein [Methanoregula sp.]|jgi:plastocyanin|nr:cupredoxin family copper-binding protein [Methanoregula sp.]
MISRRDGEAAFSPFVTIRLFITPVFHDEHMPASSRPLSCTACAVMLILACMAAGCSNAPSPVTAPAQGGSLAGNSVAIKNFAFDPPDLTVKPGTTVTWVNQDGTSHTIVFDAGAPASFSSESLANGGSTAFTFTRAGTYAYHCSVHPSMKGTVVVQE